MDIELYWPEGTPSPELEAEVVKDLRLWLVDDGEIVPASSLMVHVVTLGPIEAEGPCVVVSGKEGDHRYHCRYQDHWPEGMKFDIDDIPGFREKLEAAGHKFEDDDA